MLRDEPDAKNTRIDTQLGTTTEPRRLYTLFSSRAVVFHWNESSRFSLYTNGSESLFHALEHLEQMKTCMTWVYFSLNIG